MSLRPWKTWLGGSHDILDVCWSPDSTKYACSTATLMDDRTIQYNRKNNLLIGNLVSDSICEIPDHRIQKNRPSSAYNFSTEANSQRAIYMTSDPNLYTTVSAIEWSDLNNCLYTASYDKTVKVFDTSAVGRPHCRTTLRHDVRVEALALSKAPRCLLATGTSNGNDSVRIYRSDVHESFMLAPLPRQRNQAGFQDAIGCLKFGEHPSMQSFLAAGFGAEETRFLEPAGDGHLALWQVSESGTGSVELSPYANNVFDLAWSPFDGCLAASVASKETKKHSWVKSHLRIYVPNNQKHLALEYDCPAYDINVVSFNPFDERLIVASATDGCTYVFDSRRPDSILHELRHDLPINPLQHEAEREFYDVGTRMAIWGSDSRQLYTGGSDGIVRWWDVRRAPEDVLVKDVLKLDAEIMCGKFSPDQSHLLIGDGRGGIHIMTKALDDAGEDEVSEINFIGADDLSSCNVDKGSLQTGTQIARHLVATNRIEVHPVYGAGKGPNYQGPWASYARTKKPEDGTWHDTSLHEEYARQQKDQTRWQVKRTREPRNEVVASSSTACANGATSKSVIETTPKRTKLVTLKTTTPVQGPLLHTQVGPVMSTKFNTSEITDQVIDLTLSDDENDDSSVLDLSTIGNPLSSIWGGNTTRKVEDLRVETGDLLHSFEFKDDYDFPANWMVSANIRYEEC